MAKYRCMICGYVYDEEEGDMENDIDPGTSWEDLVKIGYALSVVLLRRILKR